VALTVGVGGRRWQVIIVVYQQVETYVLQPMIRGRAAVSGVIVSGLVFGSLFGVIGVPIAAAITIIFDEATAAQRARIAATPAG
jgi:predicted PurR-regulated permease PerM